MEILDYVVILAYMAAMVVIGSLVLRRQKVTSDVYFLAGRSLKWPVVGCALFASNISTIHLVGLCQGGFQANKGLAEGNWEWMATFTLVLLSLIFAPFYFKTKIGTLPEFVERRYHPLARSIMAVMAICSALFIHIGISLYTGGKVFEHFFGVDVWVSIIAISIITLIYVLLGGLKAVVITETIQTVILLGGAVIVTLFGLFALPEHGINSYADFKAAVGPNQLNTLHTDSEIGYNWYAFFLGYPVLGIWYWCSDQTIVQRVLGAKTQKDAQYGALFAGLLKFTPVFFMVFPGVLCYVLFKDEMVPVIENGQEVMKRLVDVPEKALPVMLVNLIPAGLRGLIAAGLLAALMSTIASAFNSTGTLVAVDIVKKLKPDTSDASLVRIGRISAVVVMLLAMAWSPLAKNYDSIFEAINAIAAHLAPPITTVLLLGVFWRRGTKEAGVATLIIGFIMGALSFIFELPVITLFRDDQGHSLKLVTDVWGVPMLMQAWWGFCICSAIYIAISLLTPPPDPKLLEGTTFEKPSAVLFHGKITGITDPRVLAGFLLGTLAVLYFITTRL